MQNIKTPNALNRHPQNFQSNADNNHNNVDSNNISTITAPPQPAPPQRSQNFSFSSNYTASRFVRAAAAIVPPKYNYTPINAFAIFNRTSFPAPNRDQLPDQDDGNDDDDDTVATSSAHFIGGKPNAIVRPIRRGDGELQPALLQQTFNETTANGGDCGGHAPYHGPYSPLSMQRYQQQQQQYGNLSKTVTTASAAFNNFNSNNNNADFNDVLTPMSERNFADELNRKLRYLRNKENQEVWSKSKNSSRNGSHRETTDKRPLFITTVPTGVFLPPAKETPLPASILRQRIYAYSSHPVVYNYKAYNIPLASTAPPSYNNAINTNNNNNNTTTTVNKALSPTSVLRSSTAAGPASRSSIQSGLVAGGLHLSKQQFQQQIQQHRSKREQPEPYKNVMIDKRVVRGSNFAGSRLVEEYDPLNKDDTRFRPNFRWKCRNQRNVIGTPPPLAGRRHEVIQTDRYLEELVVKPQEHTVDTQTDLFLQVPPTPPYKPAKVGIDVGTGIEDGELFHFDAEAQPLIDVLVDSCIEQTMLEVSHEEEISKLRKKQADFLAQREAELAELRRLEEEEKRLSEERERRLYQEGIVKGLEREVAENVTAAKLLQGHIASLMPEILDNIEPMTDAVGKEKLMHTICPWLSMEVAEEVGQIVDSRELLTVIIQEIIKQRAEAYMPIKEATPSLSLAIDSEGVPEEEHEAAADDDCVTASGTEMTDITESTDVECPAPGTSAYDTKLN